MRRIAAVATLLIALAAGRAIPAAGQPTIRVVATWFEAIDSDNGDYVHTIAIVRNDGSAYAGNVAARTKLFVGSVSVASSSEAARKVVLAPGEETIVGDAIDYALAGAVDRIEVQAVADPATAADSPYSYEPEVGSVRMTRTESSVRYDTRFLNPGPQTFKSPGISSDAMDADAIFYKNGRIVDHDFVRVVPGGHVAPGVAFPAWFFADRFAGADSYRLFFTTKPLAAGEYALNWRLSEPTMQPAGDGRLKVAVEITNDSDQRSRPDVWLAAVNAAGEEVGFGNCYVTGGDFVPHEQRRCEDTFYEFELNSGTLADVTRFVGYVASLGVTHDPGAAVPSPTPRPATPTPTPAPRWYKFIPSARR